MKLFESWGSINVVTVRSPDLIFPPKAVFEESIFPQTAKSTGFPLETVRDAYSQLISILAFCLSPCGNLSVMKAEIDVIKTRLSAKLKEVIPKKVSGKQKRVSLTSDDRTPYTFEEFQKAFGDDAAREWDLAEIYEDESDDDDLSNLSVDIETPLGKVSSQTGTVQSKL